MAGTLKVRLKDKNQGTYLEHTGRWGVDILDILSTITTRKQPNRKIYYKA